MATTAPARTPIPARAWKALVLSAGGFSLVSFNTTATNVAFDDIKTSFPDASGATVSWVASGFFIGSAALLLIAGRLADRIGRRAMFRLGLAIFAAASLLSAVAPTIFVLIAARLLASAAGAFIIPASLAVILPEFPSDRHATAIGAWTATGPVASMIAPIVSASLLDVGGWRLVFFVSAPFAAVALAASYGTLRESKASGTPGKLDLFGVVIGTLAVSLAVFGVSEGGYLGWTHPIVVGSLAGSVLLLPVFVWQSRRHPEPLLDLDVFMLRPVWVSNVVNVFLNFVGLSAWLVWPLWMVQVWNYDARSVGLGLVPGPICAGLVTFNSGRIIERFGYRRAVIAGSLICPLAMIIPLLSLSETPAYWLVVGPGVALFGAGWALLWPALNAGVLKRVDPDYYGEVNAAFNTVRYIAGALGIAAAITMIGPRGRPDVIAAYSRTLLMFTASLAICATVAILLYPRDDA